MPRSWLLENPFRHASASDLLGPAVAMLLSSNQWGWENSIVLREQGQMEVFWMDIERQAEALRPQPEFAWSRSHYRARKAAEEFSKETDADY